jgi:hypothetical protein
MGNDLAEKGVILDQERTPSRTPPSKKPHSYLKKIRATALIFWVCLKSKKPKKKFIPQKPCIQNSEML